MEYTILWSPSRDTFKVKPTREMIFQNWDVYFHRQEAGEQWLILAFANTLPESNKTIRDFRRDMDNPDFGFPTL
jgi:hypothetical protein